MPLTELPLELPSFDIPCWIDEFTDDGFVEEEDDYDKDKKPCNQESATSCTSPIRINIANDESQSEQSEQQQQSEQILFGSSSKKLETLPTDIIAVVLSFQSVREITQFALTSKRCYLNGYRNEKTWKLKFVQRWNAAHIVAPVHSVYHDAISVHSDGNGLGDGDGAVEDCKVASSSRLQEQEEVFWLRVYKSAFMNAHDLWITHWNIVEPIDAISAGRCCIPDVQMKARPKKETDDSSSSHSGFEREQEKTCPTCRYHPLLDGTCNVELENAMDDELKYAQGKQFDSNHDDDDDDDGRQTQLDIDTKLTMDPVVYREASVRALSRLQGKHDSEGYAYTTASEIIRHSTKYSLSKWSRRMRAEKGYDLSKKPQEFKRATPRKQSRMADANDQSQHALPQTPYMKKRRREAKRAFRRASTYARDIDAEQYRSSGLNFMTDALFFPIEPSQKRIHRGDCLSRVEIDREVLINKQKTHHWRMSETEHAILDIYGTPYHGDHDGANPRWDVFAPMGPGSGSEPAYWPPSPLNDLKYLHAFGLGTLSALGSTFETAQHSWHVVRLTNPEFDRPIAFRVFIQKRECYCVTPSEGYLKPGETIHLTLGVRTMGSLMSEAFDSIDCLREENPLFLNDVLSEESLLPQNGFAIRYIFMPFIPCTPNEKYRCNQAKWSGTHGSSLPEHRADMTRPRDDGMINRVWANLRDEEDVRTIYISTHVHGKYSLDEFQSKTMVPFELQRNVGSDNKNASVPITFVAPLLQRKDPKMYHKIHDMELEMDSALLGYRYRTEKQCACCGKDWGACSEHLGRAFVLRKAICLENLFARNRQMHHIVTLLRETPAIYQSCLGVFNKGGEDAELALNRLQHILYAIHAIISNKRGDKILTEAQRKLLFTYILIENIICEKLTQIALLLAGETRYKEDLAMFWRLRGVYLSPRGSEHKPGEIIEIGGTMTIPEEVAKKYIKSEPSGLKKYRQYFHHLGMYELGKAEDPNHQASIQYDLFKNSANLSLRAALSILHSPQSINNHGIYDLAAHPGTIVKSRFRDRSSFLPVSTSGTECHAEVDNLASMLMIKRKRDFQNGERLRQRRSGQCNNSFVVLAFNDLDPIGCQVMRPYERKHNDYNISGLKNFTKKVPDPGCGRYPLSRLDFQAEGQPRDGTILPLEIETSNLVYEAVDQNGHRNIRRRVTAGILSRMNIVWTVCDALGWACVDDTSPGLILIDRRIVIATVWLSNSLVAFPLFWTLMARYALWISPYPSEYVLRDLPDPTIKELKYLDPDQCWWAAILLILAWLMLGRWVERTSIKTYERSMLSECISQSLEKHPFRQHPVKSCFLNFIRILDYICPIFLQKFLLLPSFLNSRTRDDLNHYIVNRMSDDDRESRMYFFAFRNCRGDRTLFPQTPMTARKKAFICFVALMFSFISCSPSFSLNLCIVFFCSVALGFNTSLTYMESTVSPDGPNNFVRFERMRLHVAVTLMITVGQVVGTSGGAHFLAEFVVTAVGLLLGGATTVSTSGLECWVYFIGLSSVAFWGYFLARVALATHIRYRTSGLATILLSISSLTASLVWIGAVKSCEDSLPAVLMILRFQDPDRDKVQEVLSGTHLLT